MTENSGQWERELVTRLAMAAVREQRRARLWGIFFKLLAFAYITLVLLLAVDWKGGADVVRGKKHTAMVDLNGIIAPGTDASADKVTTALQAAFKDKNTQGVVLRINSPGGSPVQSQTIYDEMRRLRKKYPDIPLYAVVEDICASGGYFVAAGADRIYVSKSSIVGSIGVLMNGFGFTGLMDKLGIERRLITAGEHKGMLDPFSPLDEKDRQYAKQLMEEIHRQFIGVVREGRGKRLKETPDMFSGLIWSGEKSVEARLVGGHAKPGALVAAFHQRREQGLVAVRGLDKDLGFALAARAFFQCPDTLVPVRLLSRQIATKRKTLAFEAGSHQGEGDGGGADERHHAEAGEMRRLDERGPGVGDRRAAGFRQQAQRSTCLKRFKERSDVLLQRGDIQFADRAGHSHGGKESARALRVLDGEVAQGLDGAQRRRGQRVGRRASQRGRNGVEDQPSTGMPARSSISVSAIKGRPMSDVGSSVSMRAMSAMPSPSALALPAQS